jgi:NAD(P)H-nitrite reductase large subunit
VPARPVNKAHSSRPDAAPEDGNPIVCHCMQVDSATIEAAIEAGARTVAALQDATRACLGCGTCRFELIARLADAPVRARPEAS